jgi:hypothetical protein
LQLSGDICIPRSIHRNIGANSGSKRSFALPLALSLCAATELVSAEPATETTKPADTTQAQST